MPFPSDTPLKTIDGKAAALGDFDGKALLVVNVASGFTPQYAGPEGVREGVGHDFPFRFSKSMLCCLVSIRRGRRSAGGRGRHG